MISTAIVLVISCFIALIMSGVLYIIGRNYPKNIKGITEWHLSSLLIALTLPLFLARGHVPDFLSIVLANLMILISFMLMNAGTRKFADVPPRYHRIFLLLFIGIYVLWFIWFTYVQPNIGMRIASLTLFTLIVSFDQLMLAIKKLPPSIGRKMLIASLSGLIATRVVRLASLLLGYDQPVDVLDTSFSQVMLMATPAIMVPLVTISSIMLASEKLHRELEFMTRHDDLTGCLNKKAAMKELEREINHAKRYRHELAIMVIDLDDFKMINDTYGHLEGDNVLIDFVKKTNRAIRSADTLARFGGDEFFVIMPNTNMEQAMQVSNRIHTEIAESSSISWSVSIGIAEWQGENDTLDNLFARADKSLYTSKQLGKSQSHGFTNLS